MSKLKILMLITIVGIISFVTGCSNDKKEGNIWLVDSTAPTTSIEAKNGDMYLDTSTYDLYQMTNDDWVKIGNISGKDGIDGVNGKDGADGKDGINGTNGKDGADGKDGVNGANGKDGADGKDGINGTNGKDGVDGKDGVNGANGKDGADGKDGQSSVAIIDENGYWEIDGVKTNIKAGSNKVCVAVTDQTKTTGNVPTGKYTAGDEYICEVKEGLTYHFFVISVDSEDNTKVNLIMERNICQDGKIDTDGSCKYQAMSMNEYGATSNADVKIDRGPLTVMPVLYNATKEWYNIAPSNFVYDNTSEKYTDGGYKSMVAKDGVLTITSSNESEISTVIGIKKQPLRARMIKYSEAIKLGCGSKDGSCPLWLINYLGDSGLDNYNGNTTLNIDGYFTLTSSGTSRIQIIYKNGRFTQQQVTNKFGIRPVITVSKSDISN